MEYNINVNKKIELLAPGGDVGSIKAAIAAGADAVYCGLDKFNARNRAANIGFEDLGGILRLAHNNNCKVFLTLNIIIVESEIPSIIALLNKLVNTSIDGIIVQDLGMFYLLSRYFGGLKIHASTQLTTHNEGQIRFLGKLNATRVNLSRELSISEIKALSEVAHQNDILIEVFVHGSYCLSFSGICYMSSFHGGNSGNRGRCSQPCRDQYITTPEGNEFPLNLKDNSAYLDLSELSCAGVDSIKIEGRIKKFHYVFTIVEAWRKQLQRFYDGEELIEDKSAIYKVFNRDFSNGFLKGEITRDMFINNPRDHSAIHLSEKNGDSSNEKLEKAKGDIYNERTGIITSVENKLNQLSIEKTPLTITISGESGSPLKVLVETPDSSFYVLSTNNLKNADTEELNQDVLFSRLKAINETEYYIEHLDLTNLKSNLFISFKELTSIKRKLLFILNGSREYVDPIDVPILKRHKRAVIKPSLSVLIDSRCDMFLCHETSTVIYFQLPNSFRNDYLEFVDLFIKNRNLIPWFASVIIGEDYTAAVEFLHLVKPNSIVTNNTGIAYEAYQQGIPWIAGPYLNVVNSFSLLSFKENFNCCGSFISNEISETQIKKIKKPDGFDLFYRIYYPISLITSRQCLFYQVAGCEKNKIDDICIQKCEKSTTITNLKNKTFIIEKTKGNYNILYNEINYMNLEVVTDVQDLFSSFFIDLRDVNTKTKIKVDKTNIIRLFENLLGGIPDSEKDINEIIYPTIKGQYKKGI